MSENLALWNKYFETDPEYVKKVEYGSRAFETVDAYYRIQLGTQEWGPYGKSWGLKDQELRIVGEMAIYKATFFCPETEFTIYNDIKVGMDFAKKVETDTLTKAMSKLGICGDVYQGKHADSKYVNELSQKIYTENNKAILLYQMEKHKDSIETIKLALADKDYSTAAEAYVELGLNDVERKDLQPLWIAPTKAKKLYDIEAPFTTEERSILKGTEFSEHLRDFIISEES